MSISVTADHSAKPLEPAQRLSAPEDLDRLLHVSAYLEWVLLLAIFGMLGAIAVWSFKGSLPAKATGQGVIVRTGSILNVVTFGGGLVLSVDIQPGSHVNPRQVIARIAQPVLAERIKAAQIELDQARRDREAAVQISSDSAKLGSEALDLQRANALREIDELNAQVKLGDEQVHVAEQLLERGLITHQQSVATRLGQVALQEQIATRQALVKRYDSERFGVMAQPQQANAERQTRIRHAELALAALEKELSLVENVTSPIQGEVVEVNVDPGAVVQSDTRIVSIEPDVKTLEVDVCVPSVFAKTITPGMVAEVLPSTVRGEEYGFLRGKVSYVANYPATPAALMRSFQNEALVKSLTAQGPVNEIRVQMTPDPRSPSGFAWSSSQGPPQALSSGSLCKVNVITRRQRPIVLLFPYVNGAVSRASN